MENCDREQLLSAYYDGELEAGAQAEMERHVAQCAQCARTLGEMRRLSRLLSSAPAPALPPALLAELHRRAAAPGDLALVRLVGRLMAAAAAMLILCLTWVWLAQRLSRSSAPQPEAWERAALGLHADATPASSEVHLAQWFVQGLSQTGE